MKTENSLKIARSAIGGGGGEGFFVAGPVHEGIRKICVRHARQEKKIKR